MRRKTTSVLAATALAVGCGGERPKASAEESWHSLPATGLRVLAPGPAEVKSSQGRDVLTLRPETRQPVVLVAEPWNPAERSAEPEQEMETEGGPIFRYRVEPRGGGSGGEVTSVTGKLRTAVGAVRLSCTSQSEADDPERPCLALIATLRES